MKRITESNLRKYWYCFAVLLPVAAFYFWLAAQIPYTFDDWDWGLDVGMQQLLTASVNSRYVGNFFVVIMTRSELVKILVMGSVSWALLMLMVKVALGEKKMLTKRTMVLFLCAHILVLAMDRLIWQQTFSWVSGYANYVISALAMLGCIYVCSWVFSSPRGWQSSVICRVGVFLLGVAVQLFLENLTVYIVLLCMFSCLAGGLMTKKAPITQLCLLAGALVGAAVIFGGSLFAELWNTGSALGWRKLHLTSGTDLKTTIMTCFYQGCGVLNRLFVKNVVVWLLTLAVMTLLLLRKKTRARIVFVGANVLFGAYFVCYLIAGPIFSQDRGGLLMSIAFLLTVAAEAVYLFAEKKHDVYRLLMVWISAPLVVLPLSAISEMGSRLFLTPYILAIVFLLALLDALLQEMNGKLLRTVAVCVVAVAVAASAVYISVYSQIGACKRQRESMIAEAIQEKADFVTLPRYPYEDFLMYPDPVNEWRWKFFKEFYHLEPDTQVIIEE